MDHENQLRFLVVLYHLGDTDDAAVASWAEKEFALNPNPPAQLDDLFSRSDDVGSILAAIARERFGFDPISHNGEPFVGEVLRQYLQRFLTRELRPIDLCRIVWDVEAKYGDAAFGDDRPYPDWAGQLWNACDWCDETWTHDSAAFLVSEARRVLDSFEAE